MLCLCQPDCRFIKPSFAPSVRQRMNRFAIDNRSLGAARIVAGAILIVDLLRRLGDFQALVGTGAVPLSADREFFSQSWCWSLYWWSDSSAYHLSLLVASLVASLALLVGYKTRISTVACWVLWASLNIRNPLLVTGGDVLLLQLLFWGMFLPWGRRFAWDSRNGSLGESACLSPATVAILLQVGLELERQYLQYNTY